MNPNQSIGTFLYFPVWVFLRSILRSRFAKKLQTIVLCFKIILRYPSLDARYYEHNLLKYGLKD